MVSKSEQFVSIKFPSQISSLSFYFSFRSIRNLVIDMRQVPPNKRVNGLHWQVSQATSLTNIVVEMSQAPGNKHQGILLSQKVLSVDMIKPLQECSWKMAGQLPICSVRETRFTDVPKWRVHGRYVNSLEMLIYLFQKKKKKTLY